MLGPVPPRHDLVVHWAILLSHFCHRAPLVQPLECHNRHLVRDERWLELPVLSGQLDAGVEGNLWEIHLEECRKGSPHDELGQELHRLVPGLNGVGIGVPEGHASFGSANEELDELIAVVAFQEPGSHPLLLVHPRPLVTYDLKKGKCLAPKFMEVGQLYYWVHLGILKYT